MQYYLIVNQDPDSPTYEKPSNVVRVDFDSRPPVSQYYGEKDWVDDPGVLRRLSGIGGDGGEFQPVTEMEATNFIASLRKQKPVRNNQQGV